MMIMKKSATDSESEGNGLEGRDGAAPNRRGEGAIWQTVAYMTVEEAKAEFESRIATDCVRGNVQESIDGRKVYFKCAYSRHGCKTRNNCISNIQVHRNRYIIGKTITITTMTTVMLVRRATSHVKAIIETCLAANPLSKPKHIVHEIKRVVLPADEPPNLRLAREYVWKFYYDHRGSCSFRTRELSCSN
jgi:hypothetical protein